LTSTTPPPEHHATRLSLRRLLIAIVLLIAVAGGVVWAARTVINNSGAVSSAWFAPYVDATLQPSFPFQDPAANPARQVVLSFVVAGKSDGCAPSWGTAYTLEQADSELDLSRRISAFRQAGGDLIVSFGGRDNSELAVACTDTAKLEAGYKQVISRYGLKTIDFDLENEALNNTDSLQRRAQALAQIQHEARANGSSLGIWLTLPVSPTGFEPNALRAVQTMLNAKVDLTGVNLLAMDYGSPQSNMLQTIENSLGSAHAQLLNIYQNAGQPLNDRHIWNKLGVTVMLGQNDDNGEQFAPSDAQPLVDFVTSHAIGRVSMWSLNRDQPCSSSFSDISVHSDTCSGVAQSSLQFTHVFTQLQGSPGTASAVVTTPDTNAPATDDPARSPYPIWNSEQRYQTGYKVVWHGNVYQAKWFSLGQPPDAAVQHSWDTPWQLVGPVLPGDQAPVLPTLAPGTYPDWSPTTAYWQGNDVLYQGLPYQAKWYTVGSTPGVAATDNGPSPWQPLFKIPGEPY
jgi:chitinase